MRVVIEKAEAGLYWKLETVPKAETLTSSIGYFQSIEACLTDLGTNARTWKTHLPGRFLNTVAEVKVVAESVKGKTLGDIWPELIEHD